MKISTKGRYALRLMLDLASQGGEGWTSLRDISRRQHISVKYLEQIVGLLAKAGFLKSNAGGLSSRPAAGRIPGRGHPAGHGREPGSGSLPGRRGKPVPPMQRLPDLALLAGAFRSNQPIPGRHNVKRLVGSGRKSVT